MGYDMSIKGEVPSSPEHEIDAAQSAYDAAVSAHKTRMDADREAGQFNWEKHDTSSVESDALWIQLMKLKYPGDFRLNIWGMSAYRDAMVELGMMHRSQNPISQSDWPEYPEGEENVEAMRAYDEARDLLTARHGESESPSLPSHKFGSNDGWLVTPDEIRAALQAWDVRDESKLLASTLDLIKTGRWKEWIAYLELAVKHEGFRVW